MKPARAPIIKENIKPIIYSYLKNEIHKIEVNKIREIAQRINSIRANGIERVDSKYSENFAIVESGVIINEEVKLEIKQDFYISKYILKVFSSKVIF